MIYDFITEIMQSAK